MGRGRGQSVQVGTSGAQGRVFAITPQAEAADQSVIEVAIGRARPGWAGPIVGRAKTGPGQNWPDFFGPKF